LCSFEIHNAPGFCATKMDEGERRKKGEGSAVSRQVRPRVVSTGEAGERLKTEGSSASWPGRATIQSLSLSPSCRSRSPSGGHREDDRR